MAASEPVCRLTGDAFLQALIECTQANLVQQTGMESLKGLHMFQTCQNYVNIFSGALCWSGEVEKKGQGAGNCRNKFTHEWYLSRLKQPEHAPPEEHCFKLSCQSSNVIARTAATLRFLTEKTVGSCSPSCSLTVTCMRTELQA